MKNTGYGWFGSAKGEEGRGCASAAGWMTRRGVAVFALLLLFAMASPALAAPAKLAAGAFHTVALHNDGTVWSWGYNRYGQLGNGTTNGSATPARVPGLSGIVSVGASEEFSVALRNDGTVWTWGNNVAGQLGNGTYVGSAVPVRVSGLTGVVSIGVGLAHVLAVKSDGSVWAWGSNSEGQLGNGGTNATPLPVQVPDFLGVIDVDGGRYHTVALKSDGTVWSWGSNNHGQLGIGLTLRRSTVPARVAGLTGITAVAAAEMQSFALKDDGTALAWGDNHVGQLGDGTTTDRAVPVAVTGLPGPVAALAPAMYHTVVLMADGTVWFWGYKVLVSGYQDQDSLVPERAAEVSGITAVSSGNGFIVALGKDGSITAWGENSNGQLGSGAPNFRLVPAEVPGLQSVTAVTTCSSCSHTMALRSDGTVWSWGAGGYGSLGNGSGLNSFTPVQAVGLTNVSRVAAGGAFGLALRGDGTVWSWGSNNHGQLGDGGTTDRSIPQVVPGLAGVTRISAGMFFSVAVKNDGTVWAWGSNEYGELGRSDIQESHVPLQVPGLSGVVTVTAGDRHGMAIKGDGSVWVWGAHGYGSPASRSLVQVVEVGVASHVAAGANHSLVITPPSQAWSWGANSQGELGDGSTTARLTPDIIRSLWGAVNDIAAGYSFSLALKDDRTVWSWGSNDRGQLGIGSTTSTAYPWQALQLTDVLRIGAGYGHAVALKMDGTVWAWGANNMGQLGTNPGWEPVEALVNLGPQEALLNVTVSGNGIGSVHSAPAGLACTSGACSAIFPFGESVTLHATSGTGSVFGGWGGACSGTADCVLSMTSDRNVSATFSVGYSLRIGSTGYDTLAAAYAAAPAASLILARDGDLPEGLLANRSVAVKLVGGYYTNFSGRSGLPTRLRGKVLLRRGTLRVDRIKVI